MNLSDRSAALEAWVQHVTSHEGVAALVEDGWSKAMAEAGLDRHRRTWNIHEIVACANEEADTVGGWNAFRAKLPSSVHHIWPALPGGGVTPVLYMAVAGLEQTISPSRRNASFANFLVSTFPFAKLSRGLGKSDAIVVSGSDETIASVSESAPGRRIVGYGDRVSFAVSDGSDADAIAQDIVMWKQQGCLSVRAVFLSAVRSLEVAAFAEELASRVAHWERKWCDAWTESEASHRAQALGVAQFRGKVFPAEFGWVEICDHWDGGSNSSNVVALIESETQVTLKQRLKPGIRLQGVSLSRELEDRWSEFLRKMGATLVTTSGNLQSPPASWPHDGNPNLAVLIDA